jgi:predicted Zn-ribbon and HTH transcriptional regulator
MFGAARFRESVLSASRSSGFYIVPRRSDSPHRLGHTTQVLQSTADSGRNEIVRLAMRPKRLQRCGFLQASARLTPRLAFGLPQGA